MTLETGKDLKRMLRLGWAIIQANPSIGFAAFVTELEATTQFTQAEWMDGLLTLAELGYFADDATWAVVRDWILAQDSTTGQYIWGALQYHFPNSPTMQIQLLTAQREALVSQRNTLIDTVTNALDPFIASPPGGTDTRVVVAVQAERNRKESQYNQVVDLIAQIDARLAEFGV